MHLILTCKYRKKLLRLFGVEVKTFLENLQKDFTIQEMEVDQDHLHLMTQYPPTLNVTSIVRKIKQETTISLWKNHKTFLRKQFWAENTFWTDGFWASSIGDASIETVRKYIQSQGN